MDEIGVPSSVDDNSVSGSGGEGPSVEPAPFHDTLRFLRLMRPDGRCVLSAICPNGGGIETRTFELDPSDGVRTWLGKWNGKCNLYWTPNTVKAEANPNKKPERSDIDEVNMLFVDVDPRPGMDFEAERERILTSLTQYVPPPSAIVDSGNGYQGFWLLNEPFYVGGNLDAAAEIERYNIFIRDRLGGDNCHTIEHLMRLPGTLNLPNEKKRKAGRVERAASAVRCPQE